MKRNVLAGIIVVVIMVGVGYYLTKPTSEDCFTFDKEKQSILEYKESCGTRVNIPNKIDSTEVKKIDNFVFMDKKMTSVKLPKTVEEIGVGAFENNQLKTIKLSSSIKQISGNAFLNNKLTNVSIPDSVEFIGREAFNDNQLNESSAFIYDRVDGKEDKKTVIGYGGKNRKDVKVPDGVTTITTTAFAGNDIEKITIPDSVKNIEAGAFMKNKLKTITIPKGVRELEMGIVDGNPITEVIFKGKTSAEDFIRISDRWSRENVKVIYKP